MTVEHAQGLINSFKMRIELMNREKQTLKDELKPFLTDRTVPLDERWKLFTSSGIGSTDGYIEHWESLRSYTTKVERYYRDNVEYHFIHNGERYNKYQAIYVESIYYELIDELAEAERYEEEGAKPSWKGRLITEFFNKDDEPFSVFAADEFREEVLKKMIYSYQFDW